MNTHRKTAILVGILFIIGTVSGILSGVVTAPIRTDAAYPLNIDAGETQWIAGTLFVLLMGLALAMVPVLLYPILRKRNETLAMGSVLFRGVFEAICQILLVTSMFLLLNVSELDGKAGAANASNLQALGSLLIGAGEWTQMIGGIVFSVGTLMIFILFYQTRLIPRWLSGWGVLGAVLYLTAKIVSMFGPLHIAPLIESGIGQLMIPTAIQEMVFAVWMIAKGFNPSAMASLSAKTEIT
ncbi:MAG: DUF4386 domain-containing protein [Anaerolineales bacterium]|nr:MAG: DUF4386 domain-containing protein [Anaerolineales bacterium]